MSADLSMLRRSPVARTLGVAVAIPIVWIAFGGTAAFTAQQPSSAIASVEDVDALLESAETLLRADRHTDAVAAFERVLEAARRLGLEMQEAQALCALAESDWEIGRYAAVRERALKSAEIFERLAAAAKAPASNAINRGIGRANLRLSMILEREDGNTKAAVAHAERAVAAFDAAGDRYGRAVSTLQLVRVKNVGDQAVRALSNRVIEDARAVSNRDIEARALHWLGDRLFSTGDYAESLDKLQAAAALFEALGHQVALGTAYNSLGRLYRAHGRVDMALQSQLKALALHEKANAPFSHLQSTNAVAVTYQALGDTRQAKLYFERALTLAEKVSTPRIQDFLRANLANTLIDEGEYAKGAEILEAVVGRGLDAFPGNRMRNLSYALVHLGRADAAMGWAQKAFDCANREKVECLSSLSTRAEVHAALGHDEAALADLESAMTTVEMMRSKLVPADFLKQQFHVAQENLYSRAIALQLRRGRNAEALETAERARSRAFVDLLASRNLSLDAGRAVARDNATATAQEGAETLPLVFRGAGASSAAGVDAGGGLRSDTAAPAATSAELVATAARLRSTLVAYWVTPDQVFIWVVSPGGAVRSSQVAVRQSKLLELIRATTPFRDADRPASSERKIAAVTTRGASSMAIQAPVSPAWRDLYELLIKPVRDALPRSPGSLLTIVPHGPLGALAFAGLQDERGRYLLEDYALHYSPSGAALQFTVGNRRADSRQGHMLMVADPVPPKLSSLDSPLPRLPGAKAESRAIAALVPRARITQFQDGGARKAAVRESSAGKAVLHFATHAIVRDDDPFSSFLALAPAEQEDDGLLTAREIYMLRLDADLVVLSACRSGGGRVTGDGIATFARAFIYAGAPSIVASLWDVADEPTNRLLPDFYRSWLTGASKARALRAAQLSLLRDLRAGTVRIDTPAGKVSLPEHPVFWAGFALIGEPQ